MVNYAGLGLRAATPAGGFALQDATPVILSWAVPDDGALHRVMFFATAVVGSTATGGAVNVTFEAPDGTAVAWGIIPGGQGAGYAYNQSNILPSLVKAGSLVTVTQTALTAGAVRLWAEIWGA